MSTVFLDYTVGFLGSYTIQRLRNPSTSRSETELQMHSVSLAEERDQGRSADYDDFGLEGQITFLTIL